MNKVAENLNIKKADPLRTKHPKLFEKASEFHGLCCVLDHKYEVAGADPINWNIVWDRTTGSLTKDLETYLKQTIDAETTETAEQSKSKEEGKGN
jgi:hypothetical protein